MGNALLIDYMNAIRPIAFTGLILMLAVSTSGQGVEKVLNRDGKVQAVVGGQPQAMKAPVAFSGGIIVNTNGVFKVGGGKERRLENGQVISADGMLHLPNGTITPVFDHYLIKAGRTHIVKDGAAPAPVTQNVALPDGSVLSPDASLRGSGRLVRLIDGNTLRLDGNVIPTLDTVTLKDGKVVVQKDGAQLPVTSTVTMNDGTKVFADGTMVSMDGKTAKLKEGETTTLPGAVLRR